MSWPAVLDRRGFVLALVTVWALAYLPNLGTRALRLEEGRRATPAREMLASGDFVRPTLYGDTYLSKPPLYFWLVAAAATVVGEVTPLATRMPSVLAALGCALVALRFAPDRLDRRTRVLAALFVLASATLLDKGTLGEIDATLCFVVAAALKCWWDGNRTEGQSLRSWAAAGALLGLAGMLKGPVGPAVFYLTIGPFLVWQGRWRQLFTAGHAVCLVLALLPSAVWVSLLLERGVISAHELALKWGHQVGAVRLPVSPEERTNQLVTHYTKFPLQVLGMLFPAVMWLPWGFSRRWAEPRGVPEDLRRFLICGLLGPAVAFYLYSESRPRHLMPAFFPAAVLAATVAVGFTRGATARWDRALNRFALLLSLVPGVAGAMGVAVAVWAYPPALPAAVVCLAVGVLWSAAAVRITLQTPEQDGMLARATTFTGAALAVWFVVNAVVVPWQAPRTQTQTALRGVEGKLSPDETVYTTRIFPARGEGYYNVQFHLSRDVRSAADVPALVCAAPCVAVVTAKERAELKRKAVSVEELGRLVLPGGPPEVHVLRLRPRGE